MDLSPIYLAVHTAPKVYLDKLQILFNIHSKFFFHLLVCGVSKLQNKGTMKNPTEPHQYNKMPKSGGNSVRYVVQLTNDTTSFVQDEPFAWVVLNNGSKYFLELYRAHRIQQLSK